MFLPSIHAERDRDTLIELISENPLGILITNVPHKVLPELQCTHVPFVVDSTAGNPNTPLRLRAHIAKENPQASAILENITSSPKA